MKNLLLFCFLLTGSVLIASGQKGTPDAVKATFAQKFSAAKSVRWSSEEANEWEAEFIMNGKEMSASFDDSGKWLETETEVSSKDLPVPVAAALAKEFAGYKTGEISYLENPGTVGYEIALKKGSRAIEVLIDPAGKVLKNSAEKKKSESR